MSLTDRAKTDAKRILDSLEGWAVNIVLTTPDKATTANITGLHTKHNLAIDTDGAPINGLHSSITISENIEGYPVRNNAGKVNLIGHIIEVSDSNGPVKYKITQTYPDLKLGFIVCILGLYKEYNT